ncbi:MAG: hypothetical protein IJ424_02725 [Oscillospiraceae bacterium]|nr:hypothetical protein [Oscillospiraceae bacterium]
MESKLNLEYKITKEDWLSGYDLYFNLFTKKTTYIKAAIFVVPLILFIEQVIRDPKFTVGWVCIAACVMMIVSAFISNKLERKNIANALDAIKDDIYILNLFDDRLTVKTIVNESPENLEYDENGELKPLPEIPESVCEFSEKTLKVYETEKIIGLFSRRGSFFIPKAGLDENELNVVTSTLKEAVGSKYFEK